MDAERLKSFGLFATVSENYRRIIAPAFSEERFQAGDRIFLEGDRGDKLYLIGSGAVRISQRLGSSGEEALAVLRAGDYFGDMSLVDAQPRSADAIADEDVVLYTMDRDVFLMLLKTNVEFAIDILFRFIHTLTGRLRVNNEKIRAMNIMAMW